jgi:dCMP deaminase
MSTKRQDYISWDEYFMGVAMLSGMRSKDPNTQVGACIVSDKHKILSMGYNGFPTGCSDDDFPWVREGDDNKYFYSTHSELNAILNYRGGSQKDQPYMLRSFHAMNVPKPLSSVVSVKLFTTVTNTLLPQV